MKTNYQYNQFQLSLITWISLDYVEDSLLLNFAIRPLNKEFIGLIAEGWAFPRHLGSDRTLHPGSSGSSESKMRAVRFDSSEGFEQCAIGRPDLALGKTSLIVFQLARKTRH